MRGSAILFVFLIGCGGGDGLGSGAISEADAEGICRDSCIWEVDCGTSTDVDACTADCVDSISGWFRGDAAEDLVGCLIELACNAEDDGCSADIEPLPIHEEFEELCRESLAECGTPDDLDGFCEVSPDPTSDDIGLIRFIAPEIVEEIMECLDGGDCQAQLDCVQAVAEAHGIDF